MGISLRGSNNVQLNLKEFADSGQLKGSVLSSNHKVTLLLPFPKYKEVAIIFDVNSMGVLSRVCMRAP